MQLPPELAHLAGALGHGLLLPPVGDGAEERDQRGRRRGDDSGLDAGVEQRRIVVEGGAEQGLVAEEHDDVLGSRLELLPVLLLAELRHVVAHEPCMTFEMDTARLVVVGGSGVEVGVERRLRVDDDALAARELDHEIGPQQPAFVVALARLLDEVAVREHASHLDDALELHLAPAAADVRCTERRDQASRLLLEAALPLRYEPQVLVDPGDRGEPLLLERLRLRIEARERLLDRGELGLGELEQRCRALGKRVARERPQLLIPLALGLLDERELLVRRGEPGPIRPDLPARPQPETDPSSDEPYGECEKDRPSSRRTLWTASDGQAKNPQLAGFSPEAGIDRRPRRQIASRTSDPVGLRTRWIRHSAPVGLRTCRG